MKTYLINKPGVILIVGILLMISGCRTDETQNNAKKDEALQTNPSEAAPTPSKPPPVLCSSTSQQEIQDDINNNLHGPLKDQFESGNITFTYQNNTLTFNGFVEGNGAVIVDLIDFFDKYRSEGCAVKVLFKGRTPSDVFEWRSNSPAPNPPNDCESSLAKIIKDSPFATQPDFQHFYDPQTKELYLWGIAKDKPPGRKLVSFFNRLHALLKNGCVSKIIFAEPAGKAGPKPRTLLRMQFLWSVCEPPNGCEQNGLCVPCTKIDVNTNSNVNNSSNNP